MPRDRVTPAAMPDRAFSAATGHPARVFAQEPRIIETRQEHGMDLIIVSETACRKYACRQQWRSSRAVGE